MYPISNLSVTQHPLPLTPFHPCRANTIVLNLDFRPPIPPLGIGPTSVGVEPPLDSVPAAEVKAEAATDLKAAEAEAEHPKDKIKFHTPIPFEEKKDELFKALFDYTVSNNTRLRRSFGLLNDCHIPID